MFKYYVRHVNCLSGFNSRFVKPLILQLFISLRFHCFQWHTSVPFIAVLHLCHTQVHLMKLNVKLPPSFDTMNLTLKLCPLCGFDINISASVLGVSVSC
jgi:hypothetical protein